jgi:5-methylcytosine-specific restriction endonuclease McrA
MRRASGAIFVAEPVKSVSTERQRFTIRASASRLDKGLLAIPQKFRSLFPPERSQIKVVFDDEESVSALTFQPYDPVVKENRIFGLRHWFSKRGVREGDLISVTIENPERRLYRIALDRYVLERQERMARQGLESAQADSEADQQLALLSRLTKRRPRVVAKDELLRIAQSEAKPRPTVFPRVAERHEVVPPGIRVLLRELHGGRCQLCSFTFEKRNGEPYFEVHHLDPGVGHHPTNLLVLCPNCHAQFEHATVADLRRAGPWLVGVTINGKHLSVRQPLAQHPRWGAILGLVIVVTAMRSARLLFR